MELLFKYLHEFLRDIAGLKSYVNKSCKRSHRLIKTFLGKYLKYLIVLPS